MYRLADCTSCRAPVRLVRLDVGVPAYIDMMVKNLLEDRERRAFMLGLKETEVLAFNEFGNFFMTLPRKQQEELLIKIESAEIRTKSNAVKAALKNGASHFSCVSSKWL
ncbi:MAG: gluconate 2-dehydrogenase subunit 3 family protein [Saprospiraceae bacterium]|nr:gluconate 2-dehydrogenase subunit 3 family protein [Saprospiraceae bacterium]